MRRPRNPSAGLALLAMAAVAPRAAAGIQNYVVKLDPTQETPANFTTGSGSGTVTIDTASGLLSWSIDYAGLSGPLTAAHFHGPAPLCVPAGVVVPISGGAPPAGNLAGSATITPAQVAAVLNGEWYVNLHTALHPPGEIRGQVVPGALLDPLPSINAGAVHVVLETVATGLTAPNWGINAPGDAGRLFVTDQPGTLWAIDLATGDKQVFLDVSSMVVPMGAFGPGTFDERGLLGVTFHPGYRTNGLLYTFTSEPASGPADFSTQPPGVLPNCQTIIREWHVPDPGNPGSVVDPGSTRLLLSIDKPQFNHNGGAVNFGPDGMLYISLGDGGGADDTDTATIVGHGCIGNGQNPGTIHGKLLRIDPQGSNSANGEYGIPADNPFAGDPDFLGEIYAWGLRNPFRFSFDSLTGELFLGDVGQNDIEEINIVTSGGNYGWHRKEGSFFFITNGNLPGAAGRAYVTGVPQVSPPGLIDPIAQYDHGDGISAIGGFVYRGVRIPALQGRYVFGDFTTGFAVVNGRLFYLDQANAVREFLLIGQAVLGEDVLGFGQDSGGEIYVMANHTGTPFGATGVVLRIAPKLGDLDSNGVVRMDDLAILLMQWGMSNVAADLNQDGTVDVVDFLLLLMNWS